MNPVMKAYDSSIAALKYPHDASKIARLSIMGFQMWYSSQNPREMVYLGQFKEFQRFVWLNYTWKVKVLRFWFKIKRGLLIA